MRRNVEIRKYHIVPMEVNDNDALRYQGKLYAHIHTYTHMYVHMYTHTCTHIP